MTTVSRTSQVTHSSATGGGDWDHRLNRLLEDLQETVVPGEKSGSGGGTEYREYRMTSSTRTDDQPPISTDEKWIEYGTRGGLSGSHPTHSHKHIIDNLGSKSSSSSSYSKTTNQKTIGFSGANQSTERSYGIDSGLTSTGTGRNTQIEYLTPVNTTTIMKSGPSTPCPASLLPSSSPKVERKEFYAKASYTTLIKGGPDGQQVVEPMEDFPPLTTSSNFGRSLTSSSESRREFKETHHSPPPPIFSSTPIQSSSSYSATRMTTDRSVTPPPRPTEGLKTPPLVRKIMQQSQKSTSYSKETTSTQRPYEEEPRQYYTSTTTRNETMERERSPAKVFPTSHPPKTYGEPPKRLDELLATFDESYTETSRIGGDGGGPWKSHPYGPGTQPPIRTVRIDDNIQSRTVDSENLVQRPGKQIVESRNVSGPPVFYPPGQIFTKTEEEALMQGGGKGKAKMKMDRNYKAKEKNKESHKERGGQGAAPVPVCLPICCAAPCTIM